MTAGYCSACGATLDDVANYCPACGTAVSPSDSPEAEAWTPPDPSEIRPGDSSMNTMYWATAGLFIGYLVFLALGFTSSTTELVLLAVVCFLGSLVTMYVDLVDLPERVWGTRPIVWVLGAVLVYMVIVPIYLYKRRSVQ